MPDDPAIVLLLVASSSLVPSRSKQKNTAFLLTVRGNAVFFC